MMTWEYQSRKSKSSFGVTSRTSHNLNITSKETHVFTTIIKLPEENDRFRWEEFLLYHNIQPSDGRPYIDLERFMMSVINMGDILAILER